VSHPRARVFFALYLCATLYLSLYPGDFELYPKAKGLYWADPRGRRQILDAILNVLFYVPLGASGYLALRNWRYGWLAAIVAGVALSTLIEWLQLWTRFRHGNLNDLAANSLGTALGVLAAYAVTRTSWFHDLADSTSRWRLTPTQSLLVTCWIIWQTFPFIPAISLTRFTSLPALVAPWSWQAVAASFIGFAVLRSAAGPSPWLWIACAALPAQAFLLERSLSAAVICGAALGWTFAKLAGTRVIPWLGVLLPLWLAAEEFRPFSITDHPQAFTWAPFDSWYQVSSLGYYQTIFGKLFLYLAVVWSLKKRPLGWTWAIGIPAVILTVGEWAQRYLEGRTPESTDMVILAAGAVLLALCQRAGNTVPAQS
jgi:VanZ family protein